MVKTRSSRRLATSVPEPSAARNEGHVSGWRRGAVVALSVVALSGTAATAGAATPAPSAVSRTASTAISTGVATAPAGVISVPSSWSGSAQAHVVKRNPFVRIAVKAALAAIKARSRATYDQIIGWVYLGRAYFVSAYTNYAPGWVQTLMPGVAAGALYDAIKWVIGL